MSNSSKTDLNILEAALLVRDGSGVSEAQYVAAVARAVPLHELKNLSPDEAFWFCGLVAWLNDYCILLNEYMDHITGTDGTIQGQPILVGSSGPEIENVLYRDPDSEPDFTLLSTFGVRREVLN